jgi:hypothetical protein
MTDISGCFDRILPPIISILNRKNGCPESAVQMHAKTLFNAKYHIKTKQGISDMFYSNQTTPVYGNGQGAGDSPSQWSQESAMLFEIYESMIQGAEMSLQTGEKMVELPMAAFADDTNLLGNNDRGHKPRTELINEVKQAFTTWDKLLHASGHFMELAKCCCYLSLWEFQDDGYAYTMQPEEHKQEIFVTDIHGNEQRIAQLKTNQAQRLLGVMKSPMGDQQDEITRLQGKSDQYARRMNSNYMTHSEARLAYTVFYIPAMRYSLNITSINQIDMETIQARATIAFLSAQGFNRHMPREVVYAPMLYQGIGMQHLYDLQGSDSTRLFLQEMNQFNSNTQHMLIALLDAIQMEAGIGTPIMEDCRPLDYIEWGWIPQIRDFLHHIKGKIIIGNRKQEIYRKYDSYLMDSDYLEKITRRERIYIHRCRIYLQVATVSDISAAAGHTIQKAWLYPHTKKPSRSTLRWPRQKEPSKVAWLAWKKFINSFLLSNGKLKQRLGPWIQRNKHRVHEAYATEQGDLLWVNDQDKFNGHPHISTQRKSIIFAAIPTTFATELPPYATPTDVLNREQHTIKTSRTAQQVPAKTRETAVKWYQKAPKHWKHLVGDVSMRVIEEEITGIITANAKIEMASDGGNEPSTGISTFGWAIAVNKTIIATGKGPAQVHPSMAESFRAEAYGATSACLFLHNLIRKFNIQKENHRWTLYIDSKSLIQRLDSFRTKTNIPRWNLRPDEDICRVAAEIIQKLPLRIQHIKSHQDKKQKMEELPLEVVLNTMADREATRQRQSMEKPEANVNILGPAQLRINNIAITRDSQRWLLNTAGKIPIQQYYKERLGWSESIFDQISWDTQLAALRRYKQEDQTRIIKFVHGWLPTQHRKFKEGTAPSPRCKLCASLMEDNIHLLKCTHGKMRLTQARIQQHLLGQLHENGNSEIINLIDIGLAESLITTEWKPDMAYVTKPWREGIEDQNKIGWRQIYYGRIAKKLIQAMDQHYRKVNANEFKYSGERWARQLIQNIWDVVLALWQTRNDTIHQTEARQQEKQRIEKMEKRVRRCYNFKEELQHGERARWFTDTVEDMLKKDARFIDSWTKAVERLIVITKREKKKRPKESTIMERFFNMDTKIDKERKQAGRRLATETPRKFIQELKPD